MLEWTGMDFYNIAAVIWDRHAGRYRQKYPATIGGRKALAINRGNIEHIKLPNQWKIGLKICSDHFSAAEFFEEYAREQVDAVILIADSSSRPWIHEFPKRCQKHRLLAIICNAAGPNGGGSCIIDREGNFVTLMTLRGAFQFLPDLPLAALASVK